MHKPLSYYDTMVADEPCPYCCGTPRIKVYNDGAYCVVCDATDSKSCGLRSSAHKNPSVAVDNWIEMRMAIRFIDEPCEMCGAPSPR